MTIDERDLGIRSGLAALVPLADKLDAEKAELRKELDGAICEAVSAAHRGEHEQAAAIFDEVSRRFRAHCFLSDAEVWDRRASDARAAARLGKRNAKRKGRR